MSPVIHPSQVLPVPSIPTMTNLPAYAAVTPPMITPPKRSRCLPPSETPPVEQSFAQPLEYRLVGMSPTSVTFQSNLNMMQGQVNVDSYKCLWVFIGGFKCFSGLQSSLSITNVNRSHNKPLELIETI